MRLVGGRSVTAKFLPPPDVLGMYVFLPETAGWRGPETGEQLLQDGIVCRGRPQLALTAGTKPHSPGWPIKLDEVWNNIRGDAKQKAWWRSARPPASSKRSPSWRQVCRRTFPSRSWWRYTCRYDVTSRSGAELAAALVSARPKPCGPTGRRAARRTVPDPRVRRLQREVLCRTAIRPSRRPTDRHRGLCALGAGR